MQSQIENSLLLHGFNNVAREYILYRNKKKEIRDWVTRKTTYIERYKNSSNTANATIDDNSNVSSKNIGVLNAEIHKEDNIYTSRGMVKDKLKKLFPNFNAKQYEKDLKSHIIYKHDESSFAGAIAPYCCSITMYPFLNNGLEKIGGLSAFPKNLDSFCGMYINLIFATSAQFAGAVATSEFLVYFDYFAKKEFGDDYYKHTNWIYKPGPDLLHLLNESHYWCTDIDELREHDFGSDELNALRDKIISNNRGYTDEELQQWHKTFVESDKFGNIKLGDGTRSIGSSIVQYFQQVIYSINQPAAARGMQSAFVNFSYFDKPFFEGMFGDFIFPDEEGTRPEWESVSWLQKYFMIWFNKERLRTIITFPVESFALVYKDGKFLDEDSANFVIDEYARGHSFFTYISDTVDSLSSCCFEAKTPVMYTLPEYLDSGVYITESIKEAYDKYKDDIVLVYNEELNSETGKCIGTWNEAKFVKAEAIQEVQIYMVPDSIETLEWRNIVRVTPDHIFPVKTEKGIVDKHAYLLQTGDQLVFEKKQYEEGDTEMEINGEQEMIYRSIAKVEVKDLDTPKDYYCFEVLDKSQSAYFMMPNGMITHNCRLKNKIQTKEFNFTNGNMGVQTGSKSVITLNLNRIIQDWYSSIKKKNDEINKDNIENYYDDLKSYLKNILERVYLYHTAYNELLWDMYNANLLPVYKAGFINLDKQYLTIGINGLNQAAEFLGIVCNNNKRYSKFCQEIFGYIKQENTLHKSKFNGHQLTFNTECVPAESLAAKNYNWDKDDGYWVPTDTNLYASYIFKPNDESLSLFDRIDLHGNDYIGDFLDGGSAAHLNLSEHLSREQIKKVINYAAEVGCSYFTFNIPNCQCDSCKYISKQPFSVCPKCGGTHISVFDRIIGYMTKIENWSDPRKIEYKTRVKLSKESV